MLRARAVPPRGPQARDRAVARQAVRPSRRSSRCRCPRGETLGSAAVRAPRADVPRTQGTYPYDTASVRTIRAICCGATHTSMCASAWRHSPVGRHECERIALSDGKEHPVALKALDCARGEVGDEGQLTADEIRRIGDVRGDARDNLPRPCAAIRRNLAKIDDEPQELGGFGDTLGGLDCANGYLNFRELVKRDARFNFHGGRVKGSW